VKVQPNGSGSLGNGLRLRSLGRARVGLHGEVVIDSVVSPDVIALPNVELPSEVEAPVKSEVEAPVKNDGPSSVAEPSHQTDSSRERTGRGAPDGQPSKPSKPTEPAAADGEDDRGRIKWCAILCARTNRTGEFKVVVLEQAGQRRVIASSPSFRLPRSRQIRNRGEPRRAHDLLVTQLEASGWRRVKTGGRWHDTGFIRPVPDSQNQPAAPLLISSQREGRVTSHANELDAFGNGTPVADRQASTPQRAGQASPARQRTAPGDTKKRVLAALADGKARTASEVAAATGLARATVNATLSRITKTGEAVKAERGYRLATPGESDGGGTAPPEIRGHAPSDGRGTTPPRGPYSPD
jgi:DNA-binding transcriptional ArsR family regulator